MPFPKLGDEVIVRGRITAVLCTEADPEFRQAFNVQLPDGQGVHTNIRNFEVIPAEAEFDPTADLPTFPDETESDASDGEDTEDDGAGESEPADAGAGSGAAEVSEIPADRRRNRAKRKQPASSVVEQGNPLPARDEVSAGGAGDEVK